MRHDVRRINYWTREEIHWMRTLGKSTLEADKFNPGQKLNAIFVGVSILVMLVTGQCCSGSDLSRAVAIGATFVHDVFAWAVFFVVIGHIVMALTHRDALRSIFKAGSVEAGPSATPRDGFKRSLRAN